MLVVCKQDRGRLETAEKVVFFLRYSGLCIDFELYFLQIVGGNI